MWWKLPLLVASLGLLFVLGLLAVFHRDQHVALGAEIVYDDFGFAVLDHRTEANVGTAVPRGVFHVVRLDVRNHAKRVDYRLDNHRPVLFDDDGVEYEVSHEAQRAFAAQLPPKPYQWTVAPGESFACELVFDVPKDKERLWLRISWGSCWVDFVDELVCGSRDVALQP